MLRDRTRPAMTFLLAMTIVLSAEGCSRQSQRASHATASAASRPATSPTAFKRTLTSIERIHTGDSYFTYTFMEGERVDGEAVVHCAGKSQSRVHFVGPYYKTGKRYRRDEQFSIVENACLKNGTPSDKNIQEAAGPLLTQFHGNEGLTFAFLPVKNLGTHFGD